MSQNNESFFDLSTPAKSTQSSPAISRTLLRSLEVIEQLNNRSEKTFQRSQDMYSNALGLAGLLPCQHRREIIEEKVEYRNPLLICFEESGNFVESSSFPPRLHPLAMGRTRSSNVSVASRFVWISSPISSSSQLSGATTKTQPFIPTGQS